MIKTFIIPYFGKLPNYFDFFLESASNNPGFNWLIFTDDEEKRKLPSNIKFIKMNFDECKTIIQSKFDFKLTINRPHKLCDFKPAYGYIFSEYISGSDYWGYCDLDIIWGDLSKFYPDEVISNYLKLGVYGHFCLMKNEVKNNIIFMEKYQDNFPYKIAFTEDKYMALDELHSKIGSINHIFENLKLPYQKENHCLNFSSASHAFKETSFDGESYIKLNTEGIVATKEFSSIFKYEIKLKEIIKLEYAYLHLHKRKITLKNDFKKDKYIIVPNEFLPYRLIDLSFIKRYSKSPLVDLQFLKRTLKNFRTKLKLSLGLKLTK